MARFEEAVAAAAEQIKERVQHGSAFETAQIKLIGLDDIRAAAGDDWSRIAARVRVNSKLFLEGCLGREDLILTAGDGFLVIFGAGASARDLDRETAGLQDALNAFYLSDQDMAALRARAERKTADAHEMVAMMSYGSPLLEGTEPAAKEQEIVFQPVWSPLRELISGYTAAPIHHDGRAWPHGYSVSWFETGRHEDADFLSLDIALLEHAVAEAGARVAEGRPCLFGHSVHASTMKHRSQRKIYLDRLARVDPALRGYLSIRIAEVEPGTPIGTMAEWVRQIWPVIRAVGVELHRYERSLDGIANTGAVAVVCPLSGGAPAERARDTRLIHDWTLQLHRLNLRLALSNMSDSSLLANAFARDVDFLYDDALWPHLKNPGAAREYTRAAFLEAVHEA